MASFDMFFVNWYLLGPSNNYSGPIFTAPMLDYFKLSHFNKSLNFETVI